MVLDTGAVSQSYGQFVGGYEALVPILQCFPESFLCFCFGLTVDVPNLVFSVPILRHPTSVFALVDAAFRRHYCHSQLSTAGDVVLVQGNLYRYLYQVDKQVAPLPRDANILQGGDPRAGAKVRVAKRRQQLTAATP